MSHYHRAYRLAEVRAFAGWAADDADLADDDVVYLGDDLAVVRTPVLADRQVIRAGTDERWRRFCADVLAFRPPEDVEPRA